MSLPLTKHRAEQDSAVPCSLTLRSLSIQRGPEQYSAAPRGETRFTVVGLLRLWHLSSLDAPTVALTWSLAFAWAAHVRLPWWVPVLLPLAVWAVYITDRLLDARAGLHASRLDHLRERHLFHWHFRRILAPMALAAALTAAWIVFALMPRALREHDSLLAAASLLYFTRVHAKRRIFPLFSKEFLVGILFTLGCVLPAWSRADFFRSPWTWPLLAATAAFMLLAWLNCYAIDRWESPDARVTRLSTRTLGFYLAGASFACSAALAPLSVRCAIMAVCAAAGAVLLAILDLNRRRLTPVTLRAAADLVLLTPALVLALIPFVHR